MIYETYHYILSTENDIFLPNSHKPSKEMMVTRLAKVYKLLALLFVSYNSLYFNNNIATDDSREYNGQIR